MTHPAFVERFSSLADRYDLVLCDVWGVIHNSLVAFPEACEALSRFRAKNGTVELITNAPRPSGEVQRQLDRLGAAPSAYDGIVSSGDVTREAIARRAGQTVLHIGPPRDLPLFEGLSIGFASAETADYVVCSGLYDDDTESPDDYRTLLESLRRRDLLMICANPDLVVERGRQLIYCAGTLADLYGLMGGEVIYAGKPHAPIYDAALAKAAKTRGGKVARERVLAIGDSVRTDLKGATDYGIDSLFVISGLHAEELGDHGRPDPEVLRNILGNADVAPVAVTRRLQW
jgi:HAD superfamily hydrolase (TIGR01459 family)